MNLFLDDEREIEHVTWVKLPKVTWTIARNFDDFKKLILKHGVPERVSYDHDLGACHYPIKRNQDVVTCFQLGYIPYERMDGQTGYDAAKWLCAYCQENKIKFPEYYVHSFNPIGKENIIGYIENYKRVIENESIRNT